MVPSWDGLEENGLYEIENSSAYERRSEAEKMLYSLRCGPVPYSEFFYEDKASIQPGLLWLFARRLVRRYGRFVEITEEGVKYVKKMYEKDESRDEQMRFLEKIDPDCLGWELD